MQPQVHVAVLGQGGQHLKPGGREPAGAEDRDAAPAGRCSSGSSRSRGAGVVEQLGRAGRTEPLAQPAPQLGLPGQVVVAAASRRRARRGRPPRRAASPAGTGRTRRTAGQPAGHREPPALVLASGAEVLGERPAPRLGRGRGVDDLEQRPHRPRRRPPLDRLGVLGRRRLHAPRRPACSATGSRRWRRRRRRPAHRARARAAGRASARRPWPAPRRPRPRTGRRAASPGRRPAPWASAAPLAARWVMSTIADVPPVSVQGQDVARARHGHPASAGLCSWRTSSSRATPTRCPPCRSSSGCRCPAGRWCSRPGTPGRAPARSTATGPSRGRRTRTSSNGCRPGPAGRAAPRSTWCWTGAGRTAHSWSSPGSAVGRRSSGSRRAPPSKPDLRSPRRRPGPQG